MLDTIRTPLVHADLAEDCRALIEQLIHDPIFSRFFEVLERVLDDEGACFMTCEGSPFSFQRLVDTMDRRHDEVSKEPKV
jgi:hypothetical protein